MASQVPNQEAAATPPLEWSIRRRRSTRVEVDPPVPRVEAVVAGNDAQTNLNLSSSEALSSEPIRQSTPTKRPRASENFVTPKEETIEKISHKNELKKTKSPRIKLKHQGLNVEGTSGEAQEVKVTASTKTQGMEVREAGGN